MCENKVHSNRSPNTYLAIGANEFLLEPLVEALGVEAMPARELFD